MKLFVTIIASSLLMYNFPVVAQEEYSAPPEAEAFYTSAMSQINAKHVRWIKSTATEANQKNLSPDDVMAKAKAYGVLGSMNGQDIEAIAFLVLMQAAKSAQEDLKAIMAHVKAINDKKEELRAAKTKLYNNYSQPVSRVELDSFKLLSASCMVLKNQVRPTSLQTVQNTRTDSTKTIRTSNNPRVKTSVSEVDMMKDKIKNDLDSMSEMGEMESLRLQMAMDRMSKMMSTLSNILKKIGDTANSIIQNLK